MVVLLALVFFLPLLAAPYAFYFDSQQLDKPVVVFTARIWRNAIWALPLLIFLGLALGLAGLLVIWPTSGFVALGSAVALALVSLGLGLCFIILRLHVSYWRHDRDATLTVHRQELRAEYYNKGVFLEFNLADVVQIIEYVGHSPGLKRARRTGIYSYRIFVLRDGTELVITCLMYSFLGPQDLLPTVPRQQVPRYICWLPGDELNFPTLF